MSKVYLLWIVDTDYYKIGISDDIERRVAELQIANPMEIKCLSFFEHVQAREVELFIHKQLHQHKIRGEWFKFPDQMEVIKDFQALNFTFLLDEALAFDVELDILELIKEINDKASLIKFLVKLGKNQNWIESHVQGRRETTRLLVKRFRD